MPAHTVPNQAIRFTYSSEGDSFPRRFIIRTIEMLGGQRQLRMLYQEFCSDTDTAEARDFYNAAIELLDLRISFDDRILKDVPRERPVVFVANHPYGVLDGIALTWLAKKVRPDVKVMANKVLARAPDAASSLLPVDFGQTKEAMQTNLETRKMAIEILKHNGAIGIFPAGGVAVSQKPYKGPAVDPAWHPFAAKMIKTTGATVIPVYFSGQNSRLFQIASHMSYTLRLALFFFETARRIGSEFELAVGKPISPETIAEFEDRKELNLFLRKKTYELASTLKEPKRGHPQYQNEFTYPKHFNP